MKTTFVLPAGLCVGGVTSWTLQMSQSLAAAGRTPCVIEHVNAAGIPGESIASGVRVLQQGGQRPAMAREADVREYLATYGAALPSIFIPNYTPGAYAACAELARENPDKLRVVGMGHADQPYYYDLLAYYEPMIGLFVAVSAEIGERLAARLPHRTADIVVRPYGVAAPPVLERGYSAPDRPLRLVYAGRLVEVQKRVSDLIRLADYLSQSQVDFQLDIIGSGGPDSDTLKKRLEALDNAARDRVHIKDCVPHAEMPGIWRAADVCVLVSEYEGTSLAMLEAMAHGCVPVVTAVSGTAGVIIPAETGFSAPVGEISAMADIIKSLATDREQLRRLGAAAHRLVLARFSIDAYAAWFQEAMADLSTHPPKRWPRGRPSLPPVPLQPRTDLLSRARRRLRRIGRRLLKAAVRRGA